MREPDIRRLPRIHKPWRFMPGLDVIVHQNGFSPALANAIRVASRTLLHRGQSGKGAVIAQSVTFTAIGNARLLRMRLVKKIQRLWLLHVEHAWKDEPSREQCHCHTECEEQKTSTHVISPPSSPLWQRNAGTKTRDAHAPEVARSPSPVRRRQPRERGLRESPAPTFRVVPPAMRSPVVPR